MGVENAERQPVTKPEEIPQIPVDVIQTLSEFDKLVRNAGQDFLKAFGTPQLDLFDGEKKLTSGDKANKPPAVVAGKIADSLTAGELQTLSDRALPNGDQRKAFGDYLDQFEKRADSEKISADERGKFYAQVGRMLQNAENGGNKRFNADAMRGLAVDTIKQGAQPGAVNQGGYPTCSVASLESALYKQGPSTIAKVVADVAITGSYKTVDGSVITPPERNLKADKYNTDAPELKRSGASQIAQNTLLNVHWNRQDGFEPGETGKKGKIFYEEGHPKDTMDDAQVRLVDRSTGKPYTRTESYTDPTMDDDKAVSIGQTDRMIDSPAMSIAKVQDVYSQLVGNHNKMDFVADGDKPPSKSPTTFEEFKKLFDDAASGGRLNAPIVLGVHANVDPFKADRLRPGASKEEQDRMAKMHAYHAVAVFDYDPKTGMATVENQWGNAVDHTGKPGSKDRVNIADLYKAYKGERSKAEERAENEKPKKPSGDDYINAQRKFVNELAGDKDVAPEKLLNERLTLQRYLKHWKGDEAAKELLPEIASDVKNVLAHGKSNFQDQFANVTSRLPDMMKTGMNKEAGEILASLDKKFVDSLKLNGGFNLNEDFGKLVKLHQQFGDKDAGAKLAQSVSTALEAGRVGEPTERYKWQYSSDSAMKMFTQMGMPEAADKMYSQMKAELAKEEGAHGSEHQNVLDMKLRLLNTAESRGDTTMTAKLVGEMEKSYDKTKNSDALKEHTLSNLACQLRDHYAETKQTDKLDRIMTEIVDRIAKGYGKGDRDKGFEHPNMVGPLAKHGEIYTDAGMAAKGAAMLEKAYALAKGNQDSDVERVSEALQKAYKDLGRTADIERLQKESEDRGGFVRRRRRRD